MHVCPRRKPNARNAAVAEQADAQDLKSCGTYTPVPVRFRSAAVGKSERNVEFTAFLLFFASKSLNTFEHFMMKSQVFEKQAYHYPFY